MKVLALGDTHGNLKHLVPMMHTAIANDCDRIFQVGDFGYWEHMPSGVDFLDTAEKCAEMLNMPVYWLDGNHDKTSLVMENYGDNRDEEGFVICRPHIRYAPRGHRWEWGGKKFIALGGAFSVDKGYRLAQEKWDEEEYGDSRAGTLWFPEEEMSDIDVGTIILADSSPVDYMLTHDKPRASNPGWNRKDLMECWPNQDRIQRAVAALRPQYLIHGHLHYRYEDTIRSGDGWETFVVGLDSDQMSAHGSYRDSYVIIDLER